MKMLRRTPKRCIPYTRNGDRANKSDSYQINSRFRPFSVASGVPDAAARYVRFDERGVETEQGWMFWQRQPKGLATRVGNLPHSGTPRLYPIPRLSAKPGHRFAASSGIAHMALPLGCQSPKL